MSIAMTPPKNTENPEQAVVWEGCWRFDYFWKDAMIWL